MFGVRFSQFLGGSILDLGILRSFLGDVLVLKTENLRAPERKLMKPTMVTMITMITMRMNKIRECN